MKPGERITIEQDIATDLRTVASATVLSELYQITRRDGRALTKSEEIDLLRNAVVGALVVLWGHAQKHIRDNNTLELPSKSIDALVRLEGFRQAVSRQWLDELHDGHVVLPGYCEKNFLVAVRKRTVKMESNLTLQTPLNRDPHVHDGYSTHLSANSDYIPNKALVASAQSVVKVTNPVGQQEVSEQVKIPDLVLDVGLPIWGEGEKGGSKRERGCGGERERGEEEGDRNFASNTIVDNERRTIKIRAKKAAPIPEDFTLTALMREYAISRCADCDVQSWFQDFLAHHRAHGKLMKDWTAAWRTWVGNGARFGYPKLSGGFRGLPTLNA